MSQFIPLCPQVDLHGRLELYISPKTCEFVGKAHEEWKAVFKKISGLRHVLLYREVAERQGEAQQNTEPLDEEPLDEEPLDEEQLDEEQLDEEQPDEEQPVQYQYALVTEYGTFIC